jgi:hypothetical protein
LTSRWLPDGAEAWRHLQSVCAPTLAILEWMMPSVKSYFAEQSGAQFSHGICPTRDVALEEQVDEYQRDQSRPRG